MLNELNQINFILSKKDKIKLLSLSFLLLIGMVLEVFGLGMIFPTLTIIESPNKIYDFEILKPFHEVLKLYSNKQLIYFLLIGIVSIYFVKSLFLVLLNFKQNRFLANLSASISNKLLKSYMSSDYLELISNDISDLYKNIKVEVTHFNAYCLSIITIITEGFLLLSVLITLVIIEPIGALSIAFFFALLSFIFFFFTKKKLIFWGSYREKLDKTTSKIILDGLTGVKELKLLGRVDYYTKRFLKDNYLSARVSSNHATISQLPRYYLEFSSILGLVIFLMVILNKNQVSDSIIATLGVFVAATFRILPSVNKMLLSFQNLKYYKSSVNVLFSQLRKFKIKNIPEDKITLKEFQSFEFRDVTFSYDSSDKKILKNLNLTINKGEVIGIIGESGSGKTTLVNILSGLIRPNEGQVLVNGYSLYSVYNCWLNFISYVSQDVFLINDSIKQNIILGQDINEVDDNEIIKILNKVQLGSMLDNSKHGIDTMIGERGLQISGGQRQRIGLARALFRNFSVLILDEATSALDSKTEEQIMEIISEIKTDKVIVMISHNRNILKDCDKVFKLENGFLNLQTSV
jgi:ABC-type multidrug transport system fused ATPase/permease subunit